MEDRNLAAALARGGAALIVASSLAGASMVSPWRWAGVLALACGLLALAWRGQLERVLVAPGARAFAALFAVVAAGHAALMWASLESCTYSMFDTGLYAGRVAALANRGTFWCHPLAMHGFADHFTPALGLFAPLYRLWPTFLWLPLSKVLAFLATPLLLVRLGRALLAPGSRLVFVLPCLWLAHTIVAYAVIFDYQPSQLAPPLIVLAWIGAVERRAGAIAVALVLLASLKENMLLVWVCLGLWYVVERGDRRTGAALVLGGVALGLLLFGVVMPSYPGGAGRHASKFGPLELWPEKLFAVATCVLSLGALPLARPRTLLWTLPVFGVHALTRFENMVSFRYYYYLVPVTVLFIAALHALADLEAKCRPLPLAGGLVLIAALNGMLPHYAASLRWPTPETRRVRDELARVVDALPAGVDVHAPPLVGVHLVSHPRLKILRWNKPFAPPGDHAVVLNEAPLAGDSPDRLRALHERLAREVAAGQARVLWRQGGVLALRRGLSAPGAGAR